MIWKLPPKIKVYEALGALADGRVRVDGDQATVTSSSGGKQYTVQYDAAQNAIMANDNGSYWQGYLGYPSIAYLMARDLLQYGTQFAETLKGIPWMQVNVRFKNDYAKTEAYVLGLAGQRGVRPEELRAEVE